ncbi:hypothetical protein SETIT_7G028900v2 [Setaria italica]|uniref:Uncharacterized protein n=1 Tax=Setaria italica TaxID=4555 RepID=A0A368RRL0_SETIT|nr:hypothetical protein SETIT_7G028900v2 [Setaria italica]
MPGCCGIMSTGAPISGRGTRHGAPRKLCRSNGEQHNVSVVIQKLIGCRWGWWE